MIEDTVELRLNGRLMRAAVGSSVASAIIAAGITRFRSSTTGEPRAAVCGMGVCFECRVTIDGREHCRSCQTPCAEGMEVRTDA